MRGVFVAAGLLLIGTALGAVLSTNPAWVQPAAALGTLCFVMAAVLNIPSVRRRFSWLMTDADRTELLRSLLGRELAIANGLIGELAPLTTQLQQIGDIGTRAEQWATRVRDELDEYRPGWSAVFLTDPIPVQSASQYGERDRIRNWLAQRVEALSRLLQRLG